jgi:hypothetical protein
MQADEWRISKAMAFVIEIDITNSASLAEPVSSAVLMIVYLLQISLSSANGSFVSLPCKINEKVCVSIR